MKYYRPYIFAVFMALWFAVSAQYSAADSIAAFHRTTVENSGAVPQEMIYLHLDNTSYFRGDRIYFACYLVTSGDLKPSSLSQTVYVELLNPSGKVIDKCVLKAVEGRCHGSLLANETPFYSGYYEIRAYTRYMLNFGEEAIFSRVIPIFKEDGTMLKYGARERTYNRPKPTKGDKVTAKFYPEGGHMVAGLSATVGYELTDETRRPLQGSGRVVDRETDSIVADIATDAMGRGTVCFTPQAGSKYRADFMVGGKKYSVDLPKVEEQGMALSVDNLTDPENINITVSRSEGFPTEIVGASITCRGQLYGRAIFDLADERTATFSFPAAKLPTGVGMVTLFDANGATIADRLFFNNKHDLATIDYEFDKSQYAPHELITIKTTSSAPFSISVTDADNQLAYGSNIFADLLLASEIKGYVHNPAWYFEGEGREAALDRLLLIQGWRKYPWSALAGITPYDISALPEQGIEVHGIVKSRFRNQPERGVNISALITDRTKDSTKRKTLFVDNFTTDSLGNFAFRADITGSVMLSLSASRKGELRPYRIMVNSDRKPTLRAYDLAELQTEIDTLALTEIEPVEAADSIEYEAFVAANSHMLNEVEVTERVYRWDRSQVIANAAASYDVREDYNKMRDNGREHIGSIIDMLLESDSNFYFDRRILYKGKQPLFWLEGDLFIEPHDLWQWLANCVIEEIPIEYIKNIYINTDPLVIADYIFKSFPYTSGGRRLFLASQCSCVVFMEPDPDMPAQLEKGMRRMSLQGYTEPEEFYSPDYSEAAPIEPDRRRTLYWNPLVTPGDTCQFYNNSTARKFHVITTTFPFNP